MTSSVLPQKGFRMGHLNICSLRNKVDDVFDILSEYNLHLLALTETHLNPDINSDVLKIEGYNMFRLDRGTRGGGVAVYCQDHIPVKIRTDLGYEGVETLWLQVQPYLRHFKTSIGMYADDSTIYVAASTSKELENILRPYKGKEMG